jgi:hypothetical protein
MVANSAFFIITVGSCLMITRPGVKELSFVRARSVFDKAAMKVVRDMMSNARIQCVCLYYKKIKQQDMNKKLCASEIYL